MIHVNVRAIIERQVDGETEIVIQTRNKPDEKECLELPGGRVEDYESLTDALKREVYEETGLELTNIDGEKDKTNIFSFEEGFAVECIRPFAVYQTTQGSVDSMGVYFRCSARGELICAGDQARNARWISINELKKLINEDPSMFLWVDRAGIMHYLKEVVTSSPQ